MNKSLEQTRKEDKKKRVKSGEGRGKRAYLYVLNWSKVKRG